MKDKNAAPLGYVELANGSKAIYPMNDVFLNYTFEDAAYWDALLTTVNIFIDAYKQVNPETQINPVKGKVKVRTQFRHLLNTDGKTARDQDIKMTEEETAEYYIEFQNRAKPDTPVEIRSVEYFGLGIGHGKGKVVNQIWLLAEDVESVLYGGGFTRYVLKDEVTGNPHPGTSGIMYISLTKLSGEGSPAGELAGFLLGKNDTPKHRDVQKIRTAFNASFEAFKADKEVVRMLSLAERYRHDGMVEGVAIGEARGVAKGKAMIGRMVELIQSGLSLADAQRKILEENEQMLQQADQANIPV